MYEKEFGIWPTKKQKPHFFQVIKHPYSLLLEIFIKCFCLNPLGHVARYECIDGEPSDAKDAKVNDRIPFLKHSLGETYK